MVRAIVCQVVDRRPAYDAARQFLCIAYINIVSKYTSLSCKLKAVERGEERF